MENFNDIKNTYYDYVLKVSEGCKVIAGLMKNEEINEAIANILNFVEGLEWLNSIEGYLHIQGYCINSRLNEANEFLKEINEGLEVKDYTLVADLFEYEIAPLFSSASEWIFSEK